MSTPTKDSFELLLSSIPSFPNLDPLLSSHLFSSNHQQVQPDDYQKLPPALVYTENLISKSPPQCYAHSNPKCCGQSSQRKRPRRQQHYRVLKPCGVCQDNVYGEVYATGFWWEKFLQLQSEQRENAKYVITPSCIVFVVTYEGGRKTVCALWGNCGWSVRWFGMSGEKGTCSKKRRWGGWLGIVVEHENVWRVVVSEGDGKLLRSTGATLEWSVERAHGEQREEILALLGCTSTAKGDEMKPNAKFSFCTRSLSIQNPTSCGSRKRGYEGKEEKCCEGDCVDVPVKKRRHYADAEASSEREAVSWSTWQLMSTQFLLYVVEYSKTMFMYSRSTIKKALRRTLFLFKTQDKVEIQLAAKTREGL